MAASKLLCIGKKYITDLINTPKHRQGNAADLGDGHQLATLPLPMVGVGFVQFEWPIVPIL